MASITGGVIAFIVGLGLAGATAFGIVQSQQGAGTEPATSAVNYGTNG